MLRKDFTVHEADVADARLMGADAVLLIVAALDDDELRRFAAVADELGLTALVEVHDEVELDRALAAGARVVGVNQRDLRTFEVDHERACALAAHIPAEVIAVAESGIRDGADARRLAEAGYDAILVGETLVRAGDRTEPTAGARRASHRGSMSEELFVKICGITSEADALLCGQPRGVGRGVHLRPVAAPGVRATRGRHREAAARARPHRRRLP